MASADAWWRRCRPRASGTGALLPTTTRVASEERCRFSATSSRQPFASLSTRVGRRLSWLNWMEHSVCTFGAGGGGGACTSTVVVEDAVWPLSSDTLQVTVIVPAGAPVVANVAVFPVPLIDPAEAW